MSEVASDSRPKHRKVLNQIVEGVTFAVFIGTLTNQVPVVMAAAAIWTILALALPLFWRGAFTFSMRSSITDPTEPRQLSTLTMMAFVLGLTGTFALWGANLVTVLEGAATLGAVLFAAVCAVDPPIRTVKQLIFLAVQCFAWGVGAFAAMLGFVGA